MGCGHLPHRPAVFNKKAWGFADRLHADMALRLGRQLRSLRCVSCHRGTVCEFCEARNSHATMPRIL